MLALVLALALALALARALALVLALALALVLALALALALVLALRGCVRCVGGAGAEEFPGTFRDFSTHGLGIEGCFGCFSVPTPGY